MMCSSGGPMSTTVTFIQAVALSAYLVGSAMSLFMAGISNHAGVFVSQNSKPRQLSLGEDIAELAFSPDGSLLAAGGFYKNIRIWNTGTWEVVREIAHAGE